MVGDLMSVWKTTSRAVEMPWGHEHRWQAPWGTMGKLICLEAGKRTSLKYYQSLNRGKVRV